MSHDPIDQGDKEVLHAMFPAGNARTAKGGSTVNPWFLGATMVSGEERMSEQSVCRPWHLHTPKWLRLLR
jgi:hypothetical protein